MTRRKQPAVGRDQLVVAHQDPGSQQGSEGGPEWIESTGTLISFSEILPAIVRYRNLHNETIDEMKVNLRSKWNCSFAMLVVRVMNSDGSASNKVNVIDGSHRFEALFQLLSAQLIRPDYKVQCTVYRSDTPAGILNALAGKTNLDNETFQKMTIPDKVYYLVIVIREMLQIKNAAQLSDSGCLWFVTRNEIITAMEEGGSSTNQFASGVSVMDGLLSLARCWVSHYDVAMWIEHQRTPTRDRFASVWQVVTFMNEQGSEFWVNFRDSMNDLLVEAELASDGDGPDKESYKHEMKAKAGIFTYNANYPSIYASSPYNRANLKSLPPKHRRPQIEFVLQQIACHFLLTGKAAPLKFTSVIPSKITGEGPDRLVYELWLKANEIRHNYDETMAGTFYYPVGKCAWPSCSAKSTAVINACYICEVEHGPVYTCCLDCSKISAFESHWTQLRFTLNGGTGDQPMHVCPTCAVAFMVRTYGNPVANVRTAWPPVSSAIDTDTCVRCYIGFGCSTHEKAQHWSKAPGFFQMKTLALNLQRWFKQENKVLSDIFENLSEKKYHKERRDQYITARNVEFLIAAGSQNLSLWDVLDPSNKTMRPQHARAGPGLVSLQEGAPILPAFEQKLNLYRDMHDAKDGTPRKLEIANTSWQDFWKAAQADTTHRHRGLYNFIVVDPMYNFDMDVLEFASFRSMINYISAPMAVCLVFHSFLLVAQWGMALSQTSKNPKVTTHNFFFVLNVSYCINILLSSSGPQVAPGQDASNFSASSRKAGAIKAWRHAEKYRRVRRPPAQDCP